MPVLTGPLLAASGLLVLAGTAKLRDPASLVRALRSAGLPGSRALVRVLAAAEVLVGLAALLTGHALAAVAVGLSYLAFTGFVLLARRRGGVLASCGCFGKADTPATTLHAVVTGVVAAGALAAALDPPGVLAGVLEDGGPALVAASVAAATCLYLVLAVLPQVSPAARRSPTPVGAR